MPDIARMGERRGAYRVLVGKICGQETPWKTQDNTKIDFREIGVDGEHGMDRPGFCVAGSFVCGNEPSGFIQCEKFVD
jgi:hypothetical protein